MMLLRGGSLAEVDRLGRIQVGPESAASEPGPACYGLGGKQPAVTDADLTLGKLLPDGFALAHIDSFLLEGMNQPQSGSGFAYMLTRSSYIYFIVYHRERFGATMLDLLFGEFFK